MSSALDALSLDNAPGVESPLAVKLAFSIPLGDLDEFALVVKSSKKRNELTVMLKLLERVHSFRTRDDDGFVAAVKNLALSYRHVANASAPSLLRKYARYVKAKGDWRALVKHHKGPSTQPTDFVEFVRGLIECNPRSAEAALHKLRDEVWASGAEVPGYGTWMQFFAKKFPLQTMPRKFPRVFPAGWSVRQLLRHASSKAERKLFQSGMKDAHAFLPTLKRDPSNLKPMEWIVIDDFQLDVMCVFGGDAERSLKAQTAYVGGLLAMCVGTRKKLSRVLGPMIDREEKQADGSTKTVRSYVTAMSVQALLYQVFAENGLPDYPVTIICENASASIAPALELMFETVFEGRVRVSRTSMIYNKTLPNGFSDGGGTPWEKGWIESEFNYLWNQMADLKGYKGSNERLNAPGTLDEAKKYAAKFLGSGDGKTKLNLPAEIIAEMNLPFLNYAQLELAFDYVIYRSELRTKHRFQGFDEITEFRWPNPKLPAPAGIDVAGPNSFRALALLTPQQQIAMKVETRNECALERWERLSAVNPRRAVAPAVLALFLLTPNEATYKKHGVTFTRDKKGYTYMDDAGLVAAANIQEGTKLFAYVDFHAPSTALITRLDGSPIGMLRMLGDSERGVDITDPVAMAEARQRRSALVERVLGQVRARPLHQAANAAMGAARERNEEIVAAYQRETAHLPIAEKIATAAGEVAAQQVHEKAHARAVQVVASRLSPEEIAAMRGEASAPISTPPPAEIGSAEDYK